MNVRRLLTLTFGLACCHGCTTVNPATPMGMAPLAVSPAAVYTEQVLTRVDDPDSQFVCGYEIPTGTRMASLVCRSREDMARERKEAQEDLTRTTERFIGF